MKVEITIQYPFQKEPVVIKLEIPKSYIKTNYLEDSDELLDFLEEKKTHWYHMEDFPNLEESD